MGRLFKWKMIFRITTESRVGSRLFDSQCAIMDIRNLKMFIEMGRRDVHDSDLR